MCDYSLEMYRSRPAEAGETYQTHRFTSGSIGFITPGDHDTAVCMACDTRLLIENVPAALQGVHGLKASEEAVFARLETGPHHDGLRFANGVELTLQQLGSGTRAKVIDALQGHHETARQAAVVTLVRPRETV